jgi:hypothetical protein
LQGQSTWSETGYTASSTFAWDTTGLPAGIHRAVVWVRNVSSVAPFEVYDFMDYTITAPPPLTSVALTSNLARPQAAGASVGFTATASGGGPLEYNFRVRLQGQSTWSETGYTPSSTFAWNTTGLPVGTHRAGVWVRNVGSVAPFEVYDFMDYTIAGPPTSVALTSDLASPQAVGASVGFTATASGGDNREYNFRIQLQGQTTWSETGYTPSATFAWNTTGLVGTHRVVVWVRNGGSAATYERYDFVDYTIQ